MELHPISAPVPDGLRTERVWLRPLRASDVELDYDAVMSSPAMLRTWSQSNWPADDFTLAANRADLERHEREHLAREAFTYTVLTPDATRCLGCVYLSPPWLEEVPLCAGAAYAAHVGFWVRAAEIANDLDHHLLERLREWFRSEWAFERVIVSISPKDDRQARLLAEAGLTLRAEFERADGRRCVPYL